jgi:hypothetical protein
MDKEIELHISSEELKEAVCLIGLATAQIDASMVEGGYSIDKLIKNFQSMTSKLIDIENTKGNGLEVTEMRKEIQESTIAFQFYDRLQQRLSHVAESLKMLTVLVSEREQKRDPKMWDQLKTKIRRSYSMDSERELFRLIYEDNLSVNDAVSQLISNDRESAKSRKHDVEGEIELF